MERWFEHAQYRQLAEVESEFTAPWGVPHLPSTLSPAVPETLPFIDSLYAERLPSFTSNLFNIGCDEIFELGLARSTPRAAACCKLLIQRRRGRACAMNWLSLKLSFRACEFSALCIYNKD